MFGLGRREANEIEIELVVLRAALFIHTIELESNKLASQREIDHWINFALKERKLKLNSSHYRYANLAVNSILTNREFLERLFQSLHREKGNHSISQEIRQEFLNIVSKVVDEWEQSKSK